MYTDSRSVSFFNFVGKYIYIETSNPRLPGDKAFLMSPLLGKSNSSGKCFTFWYHMYGLGIGSLQIYVNSVRTTAGKKLLWSLSDSKENNAWYNGQVNVGTTNRTYQVLINCTPYSQLVYHLTVATGLIPEDITIKCKRNIEQEH